jgi:hypothetical protein
MLPCGRKRRKEKAQVRLFHRKSKAVENWHNRALTINFRTTRLTIIEGNSPTRKVPAWAYKKFLENPDN